MGPRAWALVPESEPRARRLYEREGFAVVGVVPDSEPGRPAKAIRMERLGLDPGIHREQYKTLRAEPRRWLGALQDIAAAHRLAGRELHVIDAGTNLITDFAECG